MKFLLYTDPHFCSTSSILRAKGKVFSYRIENLLTTLDWINNLAKERQCDEIVCLGDFFENPNLNAEEITAVSTANIGHHKFIVGNHDAITNNLLFNSANALKSQGANIIDKPTLKEYDNFQIIYLPYVSEWDKTTIAELKEKLGASDKKTIILSHNNLKDVAYGGYLSKEGYSIKDITDNCALFVNGHIHNGGWFGNNKVLNLGSLTGINFNNDANIWRPCIAIIDTNDFTIETIPNPYAFLFYKYDFSKIPKEHYIDTIRAELNKLDKNMLNVVSIKIDSEFLTDVNNLLEELDDLFYYKRVLLDYSRQREELSQSAEVVVSEKETILSTNTDYVQKFADFVALKMNSTDGNYKIMLEEIEGLR